MKFYHQTRLHQPDLGINGNCFPTALACLLDLDSPEAAPQFQELFDDPDQNWFAMMQDWLYELGWEFITVYKHRSNGQPYLVSGDTERGTYHVCIYQDGKLLHDPHPSGAGLINVKEIQMLIPVSNETNDPVQV
ncbi:hypothetical protein FAES_3257 [Fibrella aestuarina BUZ 2]|uniref:Uncharacterized protein n=1 Tax=Fibrella aestuarina BUZ 2 TaxID=1166018 RepID=I0KAW3_9BACT|nr:hypothetical protein [Fibrella aestuarina]CCH01266.1 hypothetical protein FAES_3257 [Fibrella aestuarina BUZ 2]